MSDSPELPKMLYDDTDEAPTAADEVVDTSPTVTPASFDSSAFLAGVRPTRRSVQVVERADLVGEMEYLAALYMDADAADDDNECERLAAEFQAASDAFHGSKRWYTVEKRSSEWVKHFRATAAEEHDLDDEADAGRVDITLRQVAAQIVAPEGTTYEDLRALLDRNEGELNKLVVATTIANSQQATAAKVATPGFSLRRSGKKATPGSTKR